VNRSRRQALAAAAAAAVVIGAAALIVAVGGVTLPSFPLLSEQPDPALPGEVAFLRGPERDGERCLHVVAADGGSAPRELLCGQLHGPVAWEDEHVVSVERVRPAGWDRLLVDADTGAVRDRLAPGTGGADPTGDSADRMGDGVELMVTSDGRDTVVRRVDPDGSATDLLRHSSYGSYRFLDATWSPDGRWALVADSAGRAIVVDPGTGRGRILAEEAWHPVWGPPG
jgi:hypothetical protein